MNEGILGNATGGFGFPRTCILIDEEGNELTGVIVDKEMIFTATAEDIVKGKVAATDNGVVVGTHEC